MPRTSVTGEHARGDCGCSRGDDGVTARADPERDGKQYERPARSAPTYRLTGRRKQNEECGCHDSELQDPFRRFTDGALRPQERRRRNKQRRNVNNPMIFVRNHVIAVWNRTEFGDTSA